MAHMVLQMASPSVLTHVRLLHLLLSTHSRHTVATTYSHSERWTAAGLVQRAYMQC
jgi:hypothetical protein